MQYLIFSVCLSSSGIISLGKNKTKQNGRALETNHILKRNLISIIKINVLVSVRNQYEADYEGCMTNK